MKSALEAKGIAVTDRRDRVIPKNTVHVEGRTAESLLKLIEELDDLDDVQKVDANFDMDVAEMTKA